jgi:hypothetical protein
MHAYAKLRQELGIRPYRLVGDDPVKWQPWAISAAFLVLLSLVAALLFVVLGADDFSRSARRQAEGDSAIVIKAFANNFEGVFRSSLDRALAVYAQPGWEVVPSDITTNLVAEYTSQLSESVKLIDTRAEFRDLAKIVSSMKARLREHLLQGGSVEEYFQLLAHNQNLESSLRAKAYDAVMKVRPELREKIVENVNIRLKSLGMRPVDFGGFDGEMRKNGGGQ